MSGNSHLPTIKEYFNSMIAPRFPHLGYFTSDTSKVVCPFHEDINPSMGIIPGTQKFHCFGCGLSGDVVELHRRTLLLVNHTSLDRDNSLKDLTEAFGIVYTPPTIEDRRAQLLSAASRVLPTKFHTRFPSIPDSNLTLRAWGQMLLEEMQ